MLRKDALSLAMYRGRGRVYYRDGTSEVSIDIGAFHKEGAYFMVEDAQIPLHRIRRIEVEGSIIWRKGEGSRVSGPSPEGS